MKLRPIDTRPPQQVRVTVDSGTYERLLAYIDYARAQGQVFEDVRQLLAEIARAFVDSGDKGFTAWYRASQASPQVSRSTANGQDPPRPARLSEHASTPLPSASGEAEEEAKEDESRRTKHGQNCQVAFRGCCAGSMSEPIGPHANKSSCHAGGRQ